MGQTRPHSMAHAQQGGPPGARAAPLGTGKCPSLVSDVLLSHGLTPQYHRRWGA